MPIVIAGVVLVAIIVFGLTLAEKAGRAGFLETAARFKVEAGLQGNAVVTEDDLRALPGAFYEVLRRAWKNAYQLDAPRAFRQLQDGSEQALGADSW